MPLSDNTEPKKAKASMSIGGFVKLESSGGGAVEMASQVNVLAAKPET